MKRKITAKLYEWKNMKKGRMPLLIYGARQVGKTFEMREFGALYYKNTVYVNSCRLYHCYFRKILSGKDSAGKYPYYF